MANARRREDPFLPAREGSYYPGGNVGLMQAEIAYQLARAQTAASSERIVRFLSVAGGYAALAAGYAGAVLLILR